MMKRIILLAAAFIIVTTVACQNDESTNESQALPVNHIETDFAIDHDDPYELVGFSDHYVAAEVIEEVRTDYRHSSANDPEGIPYTLYRIQVIENIKGTLPEDEEIEIFKSGGITEDNESLLLYNGDSLPVAGRTYVMAAAVQQDGSLLLSGPNTNVLLEGDASSSEALADAGSLGSFQEHLENQVPYERERWDY